MALRGEVILPRVKPQRRRERIRLPHGRHRESHATLATRHLNSAWKCRKNVAAMTQRGKYAFISLFFLPSINKFPLKGAESRHSQSVALGVELVHPVDPATRVRRRRQGWRVQGVLFEAAVGEIGQRHLYCKEKILTLKYCCTLYSREFDMDTSKIPRSLPTIKPYHLGEPHCFELELSETNSRT